MLEKDDSMTKRCICGTEIPNGWNLCASCLEKYGTDRTLWEPWLKYLVRDHQREWYARNDFICLPDALLSLGIVIA